MTDEAATIAQPSWPPPAVVVVVVVGVAGHRRPGGRGCSGTTQSASAPGWLAPTSALLVACSKNIKSKTPPTRTVRVRLLHHNKPFTSGATAN